MFRAVLLEKNAEGQAVVTVKDVEDSALPAGDVTVRIA